MPVIRHRNTFFLLAATLLLSVGSAHADEIVLTSGRVRKGTIVSEDEVYVVIETGLGRMRIARKGIEKIVRSEEPEEGPEDGPDPKSDGGESGGHEVIETPTDRRLDGPPPVTSDTDPENGEEPPETGAEPGSEGAGDGDGDPSGEVPESEGLDAVDRMRRRRESRIVRRTAPDPGNTDPGNTGTANTDPANPDAASSDPGTSDGVKPVDPVREEPINVAGRELAKVLQDTTVIVFLPPRTCEATPGAIEVGRRIIATVEMTGVKTAWLRTPTATDEERRTSVRLSNVRRHVEVRIPSERERVVEGIDPDDWLRVRTINDELFQGHFGGIESGHLQLVRPEPDGEETTEHIPITHVIELDGLFYNSTAQIAMLDLAPGEPLAVLLWPDGDEHLGRFLSSDKHNIALDLDDDLQADSRTPRSGPIAEIRRVPPLHRKWAIDATTGSPVRIRFAERFDDADVERTVVGRLSAITAYAIAIAVDGGAEIVPFDGITKIENIAHKDESQIHEWRRRIPTSLLEESLPVLPGSSAADAAALDPEAGITTVTDGRSVTHVFVTAPFEGEVFGFRPGEPFTECQGNSPLRFDTVVAPTADADGVIRAREMLSKNVEGLRVAVLVDPSGEVAAIEIGRAQ